MIRVPVNSSNIDSIGYDEDKMVLEIAFKGGGIYRYYNVPEIVHIGLMEAPSHGKYFHSEIKGEYTYERIN